MRAKNFGIGEIYRLHDVGKSHIQLVTIRLHFFLNSFANVQLLIQSNRKVVVDTFIVLMYTLSKSKFQKLLRVHMHLLF